MKATAVFYASLALCSCYVAWLIGHGMGRHEGIEEERARRADPSAYPKGSCSAQILDCEARGGRMRFNVFRLRGEDDMPRCEKTVEVKP